MKIIIQTVCEELGGKPAYKLSWSGAQRVLKVDVPVNHTDTDSEKQRKLDEARKVAQSLVVVHQG